MAGTSGKRVGAINVGVFAQTRKFVKQIGTARKAVTKFVKGIRGMIFNVKTLGAALAAGIFARFVTEAFQAVDSLAKTADKLGLTTEALASLRLAANETGIATNTFDMGLQRMVRRIAEAAVGTGEAQEAIKQLGLDAQLLAKMRPDEQFMAIAEAMENVGEQGERIRLGFKLFDSEGVGLVNTLRLGREGLKEVGDFAKRAGIALSRESARGVERAIDAFNRLKAVIFGIFQQVAISIAPFVESLTKSLTGLLTKDGAAQKFGQRIGEMAMNTFKFIGDGFQQVIRGFLELINVIARVFFDIAPAAAGMAQHFGIISGGTSSSIAEAAGNFRFDASMAVRKFRNLPNFSNFMDSAMAAAIAGARHDVSSGASGLLQGVGGGAAGGGSSTQGLSLQRASSSAGFRQRVAALRQTGDVSKKQLKQQEKIQENTKKTAMAVGALAGNIGVIQDL